MISVRLDKATQLKLDALAARTGRSVSAVIRDSLAEYLEKDENRPSAYELGKHLFGRFSSTESDRSTRAEEIVREKLRVKFRRP